MLFSAVNVINDMASYRRWGPLCDKYQPGPRLLEPPPKSDPSVGPDIFLARILPSLNLSGPTRLQ